jgi:SAM-dependent methyltransferase
MGASMIEVPDQRPVWDEHHGAGRNADLRHTPSPLAELAAPHFPPHAHILELGCGVGRDAVFFAGQGHSVLATDGSKVVIEQDRRYFSDHNVTFDVVDIREPFPYKPESFDVVYANLSLHYYSDEQTRAIVQQIVRVLKYGGTLAFACKSYDDIHSNGEEVAPNMFVSDTGVVIHLFSIDYARSFVQGILRIDHLDEVEEEYKGRR